MITSNRRTQWGSHKARFATLPTVDHVGDGLGPADFEICGWRTNDGKCDLSRADFVDLCHRSWPMRGRCHEIESQAVGHQDRFGAPRRRPGANFKVTLSNGDYVQVSPPVAAASVTVKTF
jgi:hypothetical protein